MYGKSKSDLLIFAALRLREFKGSILTSTPVVTQMIVNIGVRSLTYVCALTFHILD